MNIWGQTKPILIENIWKKGLNKTNSIKRYSKMQKYRYINQTKFKNNLFIGYVTYIYTSFGSEIFTYTLYACLWMCT